MEGWRDGVAFFFGGAFLANAVPHYVSGVMGRPFQSPFAKPPGEGLSSSTVNALWGLFNLAVAYALLAHVGVFSFYRLRDAGAVGLGALLMSLVLARSFGRFQGGNAPLDGLSAPSIRR
jgi:hypothetical protein